MPVEEREGIAMTQTVPAERGKMLRLLCAIAVEVFTLVTLLLLIARRDWAQLDVCLECFVLILLPCIVEKLFTCKMSLPMYFFTEAYVISYLLGHCYKLYYTTKWWDKIPHIFGGIGFALLGYLVFRKLTGDSRKIAAGAVFAFCFSVTIALLWEFVEFGGDLFLGMDAQTDSVVHEIRSYSLSDEPGEITEIRDIGSVSVDGKLLSDEGYLDVGLYDTMLDLLLESLGAFLTAVFLWRDRGRHTGFYLREKTLETA